MTPVQILRFGQQMQDWTVGDLGSRRRVKKQRAATTIAGSLGSLQPTGFLVVVVAKIPAY